MKPYRLLLALLFLASGVSVSHAQALSGRYNVNAENVALDGYDVVSYFTEYKAQKGFSTFTHEHDGATFYFAKAEHRDAFAESPETYLPKYGGFCAFGISAAKRKLPVDPNVFKIVNGDLYLFYNGPIRGGSEWLNSITVWNAQEAQHLAAANDTWSKIKDQ